MHIRVKREKTTYFVQCDPTETILDIKQKLHTLIDQPVNDQRLIIRNWSCIRGFQDIGRSKVENDVIVALTLRKDDTEFEDIKINQPDEMHSPREADGF